MAPESSRIVVIGAGPAGLMAAIAAKRSCPECHVLVLEKGPRPGRKLLASGGGQCNFTHSGSVEEFLRRYGDHGAFLKSGLLAFPPERLVAFLADRGLASVEEPGGKVFPATRKASDLLDLILRECSGLGVEIRVDASVSGLAPRVSPGTQGFVVRVANGPGIECASVIVATGGLSYPALGSEGDGYALAKALGHSIVETGPALAAVSLRERDFAGCSGIALRDATLEVRRDDRLVARRTGDVLFTHTGLSGPCVLDASRDMRPGDRLGLSLLPHADREGADAALRAEFAARPKRGVVSALKDLGLAERVARALLAVRSIPADTAVAALAKSDRLALAGSLSAHYFSVTSLGGMDEAMATRGGVSLEEVSRKTMESRLVPGLFFSGELLDIDGDSGGYNIQAAFSTGHLAGTNAARHAQPGKRP